MAAARAARVGVRTAMNWFGGQIVLQNNKYKYIWYYNLKKPCQDWRLRSTRSAVRDAWRTCCKAALPDASSSRALSASKIWVSS